jgi:succinate dehydrogenase / fumarate reductase cytochrome b subunit
MAGKRPVYLNLLKIRQPLPAVVSVLHRISGALLFLAIPLFLTGFQQTLASAEGFEAARLFLAGPLVKLVVLGLAWAYLHHFFAGLRFLALDLHIAVDLRPARKTSAAVLIASGTLTLLFGAWLW